MPEDGRKLGSVASLVVYPIKSCAGVRLDRSEVASYGLVSDRRWMLVDDDGVFMSQRAEPRLALVRVQVAEDALVLAAPGMPSLEVPRTLRDRATIRAEVWSDVCDALHVGEEADAWFSRYLDASLRLVYVPEDALRNAGPKGVDTGHRVGFADAAPILLTATASLGDLNRRAGTDLQMDRFRPNVVVDGFGAFAEDGWERLRIGELTFHVAKPCARCVVTTVDQDTAKVGKEPLKTLATFRKVGDKVLFGQYLAQDGPGTIRVGDQVEVLA